MTEYKISICSDRALTVEFIDENKYTANQCARDFESALRERGGDWLEDTKIMMTSVVVIYNPACLAYRKANSIMGKTAKSICNPKSAPQPAQKQKVHCIPAFYCLDTDEVSQRLGIGRDDFVKAHSGRDYLACTVIEKGVVRLRHTVYRESIRVEEKQIERGSVVFDGKYTYIATETAISNLPVVAKTFVDPFDPETGETYCPVGEYVRFIPVGENKFKKLADKGEYETDIRRVSGGEDL